MTIGLDTRVDTTSKNIGIHNILGMQKHNKLGMDNDFILFEGEMSAEGCHCEGSISFEKSITVE